jgi:hypothetical protein|tara:strand:- start:43 stop:279 length:237 start_codon:yes stop_codon:yes gene_type:complete
MGWKEYKIKGSNGIVEHEWSKLEKNISYRINLSGGYRFWNLSLNKSATDRIGMDRIYNNEFKTKKEVLKVALNLRRKY